MLQDCRSEFEQQHLCEQHHKQQQLSTMTMHAISFRAQLSAFSIFSQFSLHQFSATNQLMHLSA
jgi:hypothetical protein